MADHIIQTARPKRPRLSALDWRPLGKYGHADVWRSGLILVLSAAEMVTEHGGPTQAQYHLSVTVDGRRAGREAMRKVRADFGMTAAEEDNHVPNGVARNLWLHVRACEQHVCPCKDTEPAVEEEIMGDDPDLFVWREAPDASHG